MKKETHAFGRMVAVGMKREHDTTTTNEIEIAGPDLAKNSPYNIFHSYEARAVLAAYPRPLATEVRFDTIPELNLHIAAGRNELLLNSSV